jgi:hypothetical protein
MLDRDAALHQMRPYVRPAGRATDREVGVVK